MSNRKINRKFKHHYPRGGDGMYFFHKKTKHPAEQLSHTKKTWTNRRYTHSPNNLNNYKKDDEKSTPDVPVYYQKTLFTDSIYTRGKPYDMNQYVKKKKR